MACCSATFYSAMMRSGRGCMRSVVELLWPGLLRFLRFEAIVFVCISWSPRADAWKDHATNELYVSEGKEYFRRVIGNCKM